MKNQKWKNLLIIIVFIGLSLYLKLNPGILVSSDLKERMYYDFKSYKEEIEILNDKLASVIIADNYDINKLLLNDEVLNNFGKSKNNAARIGRYSLRYDYDDVYLRYNENIKNVLEDGFINETEEEYINTLYDYNDKVIYEFNKLMEPENKGAKNIIDIYEEFSINADNVLNTENYGKLKSYRDDFSDFDIARAEEFVNDIFSKVVPGRQLNYNNLDDLNAESIVFTTHEDGDKIDGKIAYEEPQYRIEYDKRNRQVHLRLAARVIPTFVLKEEEIDSLAEDIIKRLNYKGALYEKKISNIAIPRLSSINYTYTNIIDDVWDKQQDLTIEFNSYGYVDTLYIVDSDDYIDNFTDISKTINLIQKKADINEIYKIRNIKGDLEYIVKVNYKGTDYNMIIDGTSGEFKN